MKVASTVQSGGKTSTVTGNAVGKVYLSLSDGVTTTTVAKKAFQHLGVEIDVFVPNRFKDGYGLNPKNMEKFCREYDVILSGDTGIRAFEAGVLAEEIGHADLIITDHHEPFVETLEHMEKAPADSIIEEHGDTYIAIPKAYAVVNPHRLGDKYPCKSLAGVGVIFKTMMALFIHRKEKTTPLLELLDLVATGCIADLVPQIDRHGEELDFEVRTLCKLGIKQMNEKPSTWVRAIKATFGIKGEINATHIGFSIGPLLNAPGRLEDPTPAVELLVEDDLEEALIKAKGLKEINTKRQSQTKSYEKTIKQLENGPSEHYDYGIVARAENEEEYHIGVAGLVAGKLCEHFYRPTIALAPVTKEDGSVVLKGSARSIPDIHVLNMLNKVKDEIGEFVYGGHAQAAGLTIEEHRFEEFRTAFRNACKEHEESVFVPKVFYDLDMDFEDVDFSFIETLQLFEPFGQENFEPVFCAKDVFLRKVTPHGKGTGAGFTFEQNFIDLKGVTFNKGKEYEALFQESFKKNGECRVDILFHPYINEWNNNISIQLRLKDVRFL